jgi:hypothetical protein
MQSKVKAAWTEWWELLLTCLARLKESQVLSCGILGGTLSPLGLCLPKYQWLQSAARKKGIDVDEPIQVALRLACLGELRPFGASMLFARRSIASSCALLDDHRGADGGCRSRGALWALHPCVFVRLSRRGGRYGCFCSRVMTSEDGQALLSLATKPGKANPVPAT